MSVTASTLLVNKDVTTAASAIGIVVERFVPADHYFADGDVVYFYAAGGSGVGGLVSGEPYTVNVVSSSSIKLIDETSGLFTTPRDVAKVTDPTNVGPDTGTGSPITAPNNFQLDDPVTYHAPGFKEFTSVVVELRTTTAGQPLDPLEYEDNDQIFLGVNPVNGVYADGHGYELGDALLYTATGGNGSTIFGGAPTSLEVWVIVIDKFNIQLASTECKALGSASYPLRCPGIAREPLELNPDRTMDANDPSAGGIAVRHELTARSVLSGLIDGNVYFVVAAGGSFKLTDFLGDPAIGITATGPSGPAHTFAVEGVDLTPGGTTTADNPHKLVIDITAAGVGTQRLEGVGGASNLHGAPAGDLTTTASGSGAGGGVIDVTDAQATAAVTSTVYNTIGDATITASGIHREHRQPGQGLRGNFERWWGTGVGRQGPCDEQPVDDYQDRHQLGSQPDGHPGRADRCGCRPDLRRADSHPEEWSRCRVQREFDVDHRVRHRGHRRWPTHGRQPG